MYQLGITHEIRKTGRHARQPVTDYWTFFIVDRPRSPSPLRLRMI